MKNLLKYHYKIRKNRNDKHKSITLYYNYTIDNTCNNGIGSYTNHEPIAITGDRLALVAFEDEMFTYDLVYTYAIYDINENGEYILNEKEELRVEHELATGKRTGILVRPRTTQAELKRLVAEALKDTKRGVYPWDYSYSHTSK
ncbi:hypothetical protein ABID22_003814 [Pontibacter aydingkolensis]|uniref:Lipocalin-like domain-containing protein n=1 Tax=Pontibacter aydingkolensis TaxID=1911536 RepID=A0ABS7CZ95_9BACT|nr:hypothetical protein [Pontibacter aydingkolensis]MBW7469145.1 hypothetical protein [Pontibacter aydingkolensis]